MWWSLVAVPVEASTTQILAVVAVPVDTVPQ
jgi:hypothetical protein